jgi:glycosyltransferase involved in cell wall biosynthesis
VLRAARSTLLQTVRLARGLLAVGSRARATWRRVLGDGFPVADFPYVCDIHRYLAIERPQRKTFTWLFSGQLIERKGFDVLLQAFALASAREPRLRLLVAGEGELRPGRTPERVELLGFVPWEQLPELYARADGLVIPSRHDGWAMVVNEAFAAGLPVIGTDAVGAAVDLVKPGETGALVPPADVAALAGALLVVPRDAARMGKAARAVAREKLHPARAAARLHAIVRAVMAREPIA